MKSEKDQPCQGDTLHFFGGGRKHQGTLGTAESKQHPRSKHCWGVIPGGPQFVLLLEAFLHWHAADENTKKPHKVTACFLSFRVAFLAVLHQYQ